MCHPAPVLSRCTCVMLAVTQVHKNAQCLSPLLTRPRHCLCSCHRYWIILSERILRQFVATPALGRGPRFVQWMQDTAATDPGPMTAFKLAM